MTEKHELRPLNQLEATLRDPTRRGEIQNAMPFDDPKTVRAAMQQLVDFARNQDGLLAQASDKSKFDCVLGAARLGLQLNSPLHQCAAVPFKTKNGVIAQLIVEYRGLAALMKRYGSVKDIHTGLIYENDDYNWTESDFTMSRKIGDRGKVVGVFAKLQLLDGSSQCEVMTVDEVEHVRNKSRAKDKGPWVSDWAQMARKTVLRRAANLVDMGPKGADLMARADKTEFRYDDTATVEVVGPVAKEPKGSQAVLESLQVQEPEFEVTIQDEVPPEVDPDTGEVIPPLEEEAPRPKPEASALHLAEAQAVCKAHSLPIWQKLTDARKKLVSERMKAEGITSGKEFWERVRQVLANLTPDYYESWSEQAVLDVFLRVPKRGNPDHWTKLSEGPAPKAPDAIREEGAPPANQTLVDMMGE